MRDAAGLTLLELLIALSVLLMLQCIAVPAWHHLMVTNRMQAVIERIKMAINVTRIDAVLQHRIIRLCASADHKTCGGHWRDGQLVQNPTTGEILRSYPKLPKGYQLIWRSAFQRNRYLDFNAHGFTQGQQGTFYCCVDDGDSRYTWELVVSQSGRVRIAYSPTPNHAKVYTFVDC